MKQTLLFLFLFQIAHFGISQDCSSMYPLTEGLNFTTEHYDKKGKLTGKAINKVTAVNNLATGTVEASLSVTMLDKKGNEDLVSDFDVTCFDGNFTMSMEAFLPQGQTAAMGEITVTGEGGAMDYPSNLSVGQSFDDGTITISVNDGMINMTMQVYDRKITGKETVVTAMGEYSCFVMEYYTSLDMTIMTMKGKTVQYLYPGLGMVKTETFDKNGKSQGYSILTEFNP